MKLVSRGDTTVVDAYLSPFCAGICKSGVAGCSGVAEQGSRENSHLPHAIDVHAI